MAVEQARGCGFRKRGGLYLIGTGLGAPCDRVPLAIMPCTCCGEQPRFHRGISKINPRQLWGPHLHDPMPYVDAPPSHCGEHDVLCEPPEKAYLMWVGSEYTMDSFREEASRMGISKRIPALPADFEIGDWVFLAFQKAVPIDGRTIRMDFDPHKDRGWTPGVFYAFQPLRVEMVLGESQRADGELLTKLEERKIVPVFVPDEDPDHKPRRGQKSYE